MRWRAHATSIALAALAAVAVGYAWLDRESVSESEKKQREGSVFVGWRREALSRVVIEHAGGERIVLERTQDDAGGSDWWMREPFAERAEADAVDKLTAAMEFASVVRKVDPTLAAPGFDAPRAKGTIVMGGLVHTFALGGDAPTPAGAVYARTEDGRVVVVSRDFVAAAMQRADTYRSRRIVPYLSVELARLDVKQEKGTLGIERADDVSFRLVPGGLRASRAKLDDVWSAFAEMRAESFLPDAKGEELTASPRVTVTMTPVDPKMPRGVLLLGAPCEGSGVVAMREAPTKLATCVPQGVMDGLTVSDAALVDAHLFAAHDDEVAEIRIESLAGGGALELARKESGWRERAPADKDLEGEEAEAAGALVSAIARSEGADPTKSDAPFEAKGRVTVHRADKGAVEVVEVSAPDANGDVVVRRAFDGARLRVGAAVARKLAPRAVALRGREVWTPRIEGTPAVAIETKCGEVEQRVEKQGDRWVMVRPAGFGADNAAVLDAIDAVERARADSWVADGDDGRFGLGGCAIAVTLGGDGGGRTARVELGREGEGGVYARGDGGAVFVAPKGLRDRARGWLVDQHGLAPPGAVTAVVLERGGKRVTLGADAGDDEATDEALRQASVLRADGVVHLGPARRDEGLTHPTLVATLRSAAGTRRVVLGAEVPGGESRGFYARVDGTDATFVVERDRVKGWLDRF